MIFAHVINVFSSSAPIKYLRHGPVTDGQVTEIGIQLGSMMNTMAGCSKGVLNDFASVYRRLKCKLITEIILFSLINAFLKNVYGFKNSVKNYHIPEIQRAFVDRELSLHDGVCMSLG